MVIDIKPILRVGVAAQAAALATQNLKGLKGKRPSTKRIIKKGVTNIVGISLLQTQSKLIGSIV